MVQRGFIWINMLSVLAAETKDLHWLDLQEINVHTCWLQESGLSFCSNYLEHGHELKGDKRGCDNAFIWSYMQMEPVEGREMYMNSAEASLA